MQRIAQAVVLMFVNCQLYGWVIGIEPICPWELRGVSLYKVGFRLVAFSLPRVRNHLAGNEESVSQRRPEFPATVAK